jgi:hypothetical protein
MDVIYRAAMKAGYSSVKIEIDINSGKITATATKGEGVAGSDGATGSNGKRPREATDNEWDKI